MSETKPDANELRIRDILRARVDGLDATLPATPKALPDGYDPEPAEGDWWDRLYDEPSTPTPEEPADEAEPAPPLAKPSSKAPVGKSKKRKKKRRRPDAAAPRTAFDSQPQDSRQSLLDAYDRIPRRIRWLIYHATAAAAGWRFGWVDWSTDTAAWFAAGHWVSPSAFALYGLGGVLLAIYRHSRRWAWPVAWAAAIPVSSVVAGVLLYGTGYQP